MKEVGRQLRSQVASLRQLGGEGLLRLFREPDLLEQAQLLTRNGLFDADWYRAHYPDTPPHGGLLHFLIRGWLKGNSPGPSFDLTYYAHTYSDVAAAGLNPAIHFEKWGRDEGRRPLPPAPPVVAYDWEPAEAEAQLARVARGSPWPILRQGASVTVLVHSASNLFMAEIAELVEAGFKAAGYSAILADEGALLDGAPTSATRVIVAPHEFFRLPRSVPVSWAEGSILVNVEQLHTAWFAEGLEALRAAAAIWDISLQSAASLARSGLPAAFLPLGYVPDFPLFATRHQVPKVPALASLEPAVVHARPLEERPIDLFFIGYLSPRRSGILERMAERLARWRCHFVLTSPERPMRRGSNAVLESEATLALIQRSKIVLNLHQSEELFFEWHRIVLQGIWQQALVVTEPVAQQLHFRAGEHYLEAPLDELPDLLDWVLGSQAGQVVRERVRTAAFRQLTQRVDLAQTLTDLVGPTSA